MRRAWGLAVFLFFSISASGYAETSDDTTGWQRIDSRYCTLWIEPTVSLKKINRRVSTRWVRSPVKLKKGASPDQQLAAKCDILFRRAEEVLDMYPPGLHVTIKVTENQSRIKNLHAAYYGHGTEAAAFYRYQNNTIYATAKDLSESVLVHEMAHCIVDHYFDVRPPRKIEEVLAMHVDAELRN
jgi:hypothetical protein